ncbi:MAG: hypothetical protein IV093_01960 [Rubrivivax sp.]|nr:hypothetical protein [Rubrivivax sp.]
MNPWPDTQWTTLERDAQGWHRPTPAWWRAFFARPELALVPESCQAERRLHTALQAEPLRPVTPQELAALKDADARENWQHALAFRDDAQAAGTLEGWLLRLFRGGPITLPPLFIELVLQALVRGLLDDSDDAFEWRAAELLFRPQRVTHHEGRVLLGDRDTLDLNHETQGFGTLGQLLVEAQAPLRRLDLQVLSPDNSTAYFERAAKPQLGTPFLLDLTHQVQRDLGHGIQFGLVNKHSGLQALARVLVRWTRHLLGVQVTIEPLQQVDDTAWRWHLGLDAEASTLLNDLYEGRDIEPERQQRLLSLFRLRFADPGEMRPDVAGAPVYLGLMADAQQLVKLKPQNLLLNLPVKQGS